MFKHWTLLLFMVFSMFACATTDGAGPGTPYPVDSEVHGQDGRFQSKEETASADPDGEKKLSIVPSNEATPQNNNAAAKHKETAKKEMTIKKPRTVDGFVQGNAAYQIPPKMFKGVTSPVDLWIDENISAEELKTQLKNYLLENINSNKERHGDADKVKSKKIVFNTTVEQREVRIAKHMSATLEGTDFEIKAPANQEVQTHYTGIPLKWSWSVKPKVSGENLPLTLTVMADPGEGKTPSVEIRETVLVGIPPVPPPHTIRECLERINVWVGILFGAGTLGSFLLAAYKWWNARRTGNAETPRRKRRLFRKI